MQHLFYFLFDNQHHKASSGNKNVKNFCSWWMEIKKSSKKLRKTILRFIMFDPSFSKMSGNAVKSAFGLSVHQNLFSSTIRYVFREMCRQNISSFHFLLMVGIRKKKIVK
jgi:hypothetical protein